MNINVSLSSFGDMKSPPLGSGQGFWLLHPVECRRFLSRPRPKEEGRASILSLLKSTLEPCVTTSAVQLPCWRPWGKAQWQCGERNGRSCAASHQLWEQTSHLRSGSPASTSKIRDKPSSWALHKLLATKSGAKEDDGLKPQYQN